MIGQTISHYVPKAHQPPADKILEKLGEGGMFQNHTRVQYASGGDFQNPPQRSVGGGML